MAAELRAFDARMAEVVRGAGVPHHTVLKDYALTYILAGIASVPDLAEGMAFKGGTALRKCYFPDYRYSEDLDFSADGRTWDEPTLTPDDFRDQDVLSAYERQWDARLSNFVVELPSFDEARAELDKILAKVFAARTDMTSR